MFAIYPHDLRGSVLIPAVWTLPNRHWQLRGIGPCARHASVREELDAVTVDISQLCRDGDGLSLVLPCLLNRCIDLNCGYVVTRHDLA